MSEQHQPLKVFVDGEYVELPVDATYDIAEQQIVRREPLAIAKAAVPRVVEWGPRNLREEVRNTRHEFHIPDGLTYSA